MSEFAPMSAAEIWRLNAITGLAYRVPCEYCGRDAFQRCLGYNGKEQGWFHATRVEKGVNEGVETYLSVSRRGRAGNEW